MSDDRTERAWEDIEDDAGAGVPSAIVDLDLSAQIAMLNTTLLELAEIVLNEELISDPANRRRLRSLLATRGDAPAVEAPYVRVPCAELRVGDVVCGYVSGDGIEYHCADRCDHVVAKIDDEGNARDNRGDVLIGTAAIGLVRTPRPEPAPCGYTTQPGRWCGRMAGHMGEHGHGAKGAVESARPWPDDPDPEWADVPAERVDIYAVAKSIAEWRAGDRRWDNFKGWVTHTHGDSCFSNRVQWIKRHDHRARKLPAPAVPTYNGRPAGPGNAPAPPAPEPGDEIASVHAGGLHIFKEGNWDIGHNAPTIAAAFNRAHVARVATLRAEHATAIRAAQDRLDEARHGFAAQMQIVTVGRDAAIARADALQRRIDEALSECHAADHKVKAEIKRGQDRNDGLGHQLVNEALAVRKAVGRIADKLVILRGERS